MSVAPPRPAFGRLVFLAPALAALLVGLWAGLIRMGWAFPGTPDLVAAHGPLMVVGFLTAVVSVERAVALARPWAWVGPALSTAGAVVAAVGLPWGAGLASLGAWALVVVFVELTRRERALHMAIMCVGAVVGAVATTAWASGVPVARVVGGWEAFLVLTIAGERLELGRLQRLSGSTRGVLVGLVVVTAMVLPATGFAGPLGDLGVRALGAVWIGLAVWLGRNDIARRTIRTAGLPRFAGTCLLLGYAWLGAGGLAMLGWGQQVAGLRYDAQLHAVFLGFTLSMVLGHAPIIFPAVLRVQVPFRAVAWGPLVLLHASLVVRIAGDLTGYAPARSAGGLLGAVALLLFLLTTAAGIVRALAVKG